MVLHRFRRVISTAFGLLLVSGCASSITPGFSDAQVGHDAHPLVDGTTGVDTVTMPRACNDGPSTLPIAPYGGVTANCNIANVSCPPGENLVVHGVDARFPCDCSASSDPVIEMRFDVTDRDDDVSDIALDANMMGCVHPGYHARGTAFAFQCGTAAGPLGQWAVLLRDTAGNTAWVGFTGLGACANVHYTCRRVQDLGSYPIVCDPT